MKKMIGILIVVAMMILSACNDGQEEDVETITELPVDVSDVRSDDFTTTRTYIARTMPGDQMPVILQSPGEVDELFVEKGDTVEEGEKIAEIITPHNIRLEIEAPMDGVVHQLNLVEERFASNEEPAAIIINVDPLKLTFNVPSNEVDKFSVGDSLTLSNNKTATITFVSNTAGDTGLFAVEAEIEEPGDLLAGVTVRVELEEVLAEDVLIVPTEAVVERSGESFVYIVEDGIAKAVEVDVIVMQTAETAIEAKGDATLNTNSQVITRGQLTISDGQAVRIIGEGQ